MEQNPSCPAVCGTSKYCTGTSMNAHVSKFESRTYVRVDSLIFYLAFIAAVRRRLPQLRRRPYHNYDINYTTTNIFLSQTKTPVKIWIPCPRTNTPRASVETPSVFQTSLLEAMLGELGRLSYLEPRHGSFSTSRRRIFCG